VNGRAGAASGDDRLMVAVLIASALHALVIFGITFDSDPPRSNRFQVEVTLTQRPGQRPTEARHIAAADQLGSGDEALRDLNAGAEAALSRAAPPALPRTESRAEGRRKPSARSVDSTQGTWQVQAREGVDEGEEEMSEAEQRLAQLHRRLAELEANLQPNQQHSARQPRVRRVEAVSARAAEDAAYLAEWRQRVEEVGNQYYPQASLRYGIFGDLRMLVTVRSDGQLEDVRILESSGFAVLDEAAIRIVRLAAPFPPFPEALAASTDKLEIVRRWQFEQNPLSSR
jgi:protein TonB